MKQPYLYYITWGDGGSPTPSILPKELQACEYLETDGNSYIKTDVIFDSTSMNFYAEFKIPIGTSYGIFGGRETQNSKTFASLRGSSGSCVFDCGNNAQNRIETNSNTSTEIVYKYENYTTSMFNNVTQQIESQLFIPSNQRTVMSRILHIFTVNTGGVLSSIKNGVQCKSFRIPNVIDLYPSYVKNGKTFVDNKGNACQAGTPGMYDVVNNLFYTNDGTGAFTVGPDIII